MAITLTARKGWDTPRAVVETNDTLVNAAATTMKFANIPSYAYKAASDVNALEVAFKMGAEAQAATVNLFAARDNGDIVLVWTGTVTAGSMVSTDSKYYVDTFATTTDNWITTIKEVDSGGNNRMSRIVLDTCGYSYFFCQFTGLSSEAIQAIYSGF